MASRLGQIGNATSGLVIDRVLAGPLPEAAARSVVEHRVVQRVIAELYTRDELGTVLTDLLDDERTRAAVRDALSSPEFERLADDLTEQLVRSPQFHRLLEEVLSSPEIRSALTHQTSSFADELVAKVRRKAMEQDARASRVERAESTPYAGVATRGVAFVVDAAITHVVFAVGGALTSLVVSLFGTLRPEWLVATLAGVAWLVLVGTYFVGFWASMGQTPGMRLMRLRVETTEGGVPSIARSLLRFVGLVLAIVPFFAGIVPVLFDERRRALQDFLARTVVLYAPGSNGG